MLCRRRLLASATATLGLTACASAPSTSGKPWAALDGFPAAPLSPALPRERLSGIALTSCAHQDSALPLYEVVRAAEPDVLIMLGDNVYGSDTPDDPHLSGLRAAYWRMARRREFRALVREVPTLAVWDDHDFGINDGGGDFVHKALAQAMFNAFWSLPPDAPPRLRPGTHRAAMIGPPREAVQVILLDTRFFRDPLLPTDEPMARGKERYVAHPADSRADVLGEEQWAWLEAELKKPAEVRVIASSIQVVADTHGWERWGLFPAARGRLYRLIETTGAGGVVFVSGDRHHGSIHRVSEGVSRPLFDLTASSINSPATPLEGTDAVAETGPTMIGRGYAPVNFGWIGIDWAARSLRLELRGATGAVVREATAGF